VRTNGLLICLASEHVCLFVSLYNDAVPSSMSKSVTNDTDGDVLELVTSHDVPLRDVKCQHK
jgi:hypothetical protein